MILSASDIRWLLERWQKWEGIARYHAILRDSAIDYAARHRERCTEALIATLPRETIARYSLDNPIPEDAKFRGALAIAVERRRARMGRTAGRVKPRSIAGAAAYSKENQNADRP